MDFSKLAAGNTSPEWGTVLLGICGIKEEWNRVDHFPWWESNQKDIRGKLEKAVTEIQLRTEKIVLERQQFPGAVEFIQKWLKEHAT